MARVIPIVAVCLMYIGFSASGCVLAGQAVGQLLARRRRRRHRHLRRFIVVVTLFGYRVIHLLGRVASVVGVAAFAYMFSRLFATHDVRALLAERHFSLSQFLLAMSLSASWQIAFGPMSPITRATCRGHVGGRGFRRRRPRLGHRRADLHDLRGVSPRRWRARNSSTTRWPTSWALGSAGVVAGLLYFSIAFGKVTVTSLNAYGSFMSMATIVSGFRRGLRLSLRHRLLYIVAMVGVSALLALTGRHSFLKAFEAFILCLLAVFTPWSAINLVDYYCFTRSRYDVPALSDPDGRYGRWNTTGIVIYLIGIVVQIPFLSTAFYTGPLVEPLGGVDISWIVGLLVPGILYYALDAPRSAARRRS